MKRNIGTLQKMFMRSFTKAVERLGEMKLHVPTCALDNPSMTVGPLCPMVSRWWKYNSKDKLTADNFFIFSPTDNNEAYNSFNQTVLKIRGKLAGDFRDYYKLFQTQYDHNNHDCKCKYYHGSNCAKRVKPTIPPTTNNEFQMDATSEMHVELETKEEENNRYFWILICLTIVFYQPSEIRENGKSQVPGPSALSDLTFRASLQQQEIVKLRNHLLAVPQSNWDELYSHIVKDHVRSRENGISELREPTSKSDNGGVVAVERILNTMFLRYPSPSFIEDFGDRLPWNFFVRFDVDVKDAKDEVASSKIKVGFSEPYYVTAAKIIIVKAKTDRSNRSNKSETKTSYAKGSWRAEILRLTTEKLISDFALIRSLSHLAADYVWAVEES